MQGFVANTDVEWFRFLRNSPYANEVNFWRPKGGTSFKALQPGEPLIFKLKKAHGHRIVGFGLFLSFTPMTAHDAWDLFGPMNGAATRDAMMGRIARYAGGRPTPTHRVGAILLVSPVFFPDDMAVIPPDDWQQNIVVGKGYDLSEGIGARVWRDCLARARALELDDDARVNLDLVLAQAPHGRPRLISPRLGQGTFRLAVTQAYGRCAVTGEHSLPALDAAHIVPFAENGPHTIDNGLLLRADIHRLYDRHYVSVTPDFEFVVSDRLRDEFQNGRQYYAHREQKIILPGDPQFAPNREYLAEHYNRFRAAS